MKSVHPHEHLYQCTKCNKAYNTHNDRDMHFRAVHHEKILKCKLCPYSVEKEYKMVKHAMIHSSRKYKYDRCNVALNSREALREHTKHHLDDA